MLLTRSRSICLPLFSIGSRYWPAPISPSGICSSAGGGCVSGARGWVGSHSTYFSPSSDCGRIRQEASVRKSWKPESLMLSTATALPGSSSPLRRTGSPGSETVTSSTVPTVAPAIRTSSPLTRKPALSK